MRFSSMTELAKQINNIIGKDFCRDFQYLRKKLKGASRATSTDMLIGNIHDDEWWAINEGGNTELQYHIFVGDESIQYGLGFNAQYVQFKNEFTPIDYIKPFMQAFLQLETQIRSALPD